MEKRRTRHGAERVLQARIDYLRELKKYADKGELTTCSVITSAHHQGMATPTILINKSIISKIDGKYQWISDKTPEQVADNLTKWHSAYGKKVKKSNGDKPKMDNIDAIIKLAAVAAEYGIEDKKGFIKKMLDT